MAKETIDVEKVVEWAYRVQCIDRHVGSPDDVGRMCSTSGGLGEYVRLGTRVDHSGAAVKAIGSSVLDDAETIHSAVLALRDVYLEWRARDVVELWDERKAREAGMAFVKGGIAPVYEQVETAPTPLETVTAAVLIILNARTGSRPEWHPDWRPSSRIGEDGLDRREVMHARALYLAWRLALCRLADALAGRLEFFDVTPPSAPEMPWKAKRPIIVEDLVTKPPRRTKIAPKRQQKRA